MSPLRLRLLVGVAPPLLVAGAFVLLALAGPGAPSTVRGAPPPAQATGSFCAATGSGTDPFVDDDGSVFEPVIDCLAASGITSGGPGGLPANEYGPGLAVSRAQMASFIARLMDTAEGIEVGPGVGSLAPYDGSNDFSDVTAGNVHLQAINRLSAAGITSGGPGGRPPSEFGPGLPISRAQMATFINRAHEVLTGATLRTDADYFTDDDGSAHEPNINGIASAGIAVGDGAVTFGAGEPVTRGQMAAFLIRHLAVLDDAGFVTPLPAQAFSPFSVAAGADATPAHTQELSPGTEPPDGVDIGATSTLADTDEVQGDEQPPEQDPCTLLVPDEVAPIVGGSVTEQELEAGDACGYTGGDDTLRVALALIAAGPDSHWLPDDVAGASLDVEGRPARWVAGYPVDESSLLVVELADHDLILELSSRGARHTDETLRRHAVALAVYAIERYQP